MGKFCTWVEAGQIERLAKLKAGPEKEKAAAVNAFLVEVHGDLQDFPEETAVGFWNGVSTAVRASKETEQA